EPRLLPWRSVEQNVRLAAPEASDDMLDRLFSVLDLTGYRQHFPGELSLGMARRVAIARAFAREPDFLLLDEPFVSLDTPLAARLRHEFTQLLAMRPLTAVLVTHDLKEAAQLADTVCVLSTKPSRIVACMDMAPPREARTPEDIEQMQQRIVSLLQDC
ncbi:MAG: ATP-binding cassette domain-containing protein, partial [Hyphomicrobiales bacterium]|nr:ATP-binding cassette domain-containing protein [Hyphomicrobiales bacterium]